MPSYVKTPWMLSENGLKLQCSLMTTVRNYACKFYMSWHFQLQMTKSQLSSDSAQRWALSGRWNRDGYCETRSLGRWEGRPLWCEEESVRPETRTAEMPGPSCHSCTEVCCGSNPDPLGFTFMVFAVPPLDTYTASEPLGVWKQVPPLNVTF